MSELIPLSQPDLDGDLSSLMGLMQSSEMLVNLLHGFFTRVDTRRSQDFDGIAESIARAKADIRDLRPCSDTQNGFPTAGAELLAITQDTESATNAIMTAAETVLGLDRAAPDLADRINDEVMKIFESCAFQDITGQRISKIVKVLTLIENRVSHLAAAIGVEEDAPAGDVLTAAEQRARDLLLNGPALSGPETRQADIDALFA